MERQVHRFLGQLRSMLRPAVPFMRLSALDRRTAFDVCIIGSGPAGVVLGYDLVQRGWTVLILEAGPKPNTRASESVAKLQAYKSSGSISYPFASSHYQGLGGSSNLWFGACPRLHPLDLQNNAYTPPAAAWPLSYADLDPYYERAESTLCVQGAPLSQHHPPRKRDLAPGVRSNSASLKSMLRDVGIIVDSAPMSKGPGGRDAFRVSRDLLPRLSAKRHRSLVCRGTVTRLRADSSGHINGAEIQDSEAERRVVQARVYVVACGGLQTARLLLLSRCRSFPDGIGNSSGLVGKYFMEHLKITFDGIIPHRHFLGAGRSHQFYEQFKRQGLGSVILGFGIGRRGGQKVLRISADIEMFPAQGNRVVLAHDLQDCFGNSGLELCLALSDYDVRSANAVRALIQRIYADLGAMDVAAVRDEQGDISYLYHHMGTCRMGCDPKHSVTDGDLRVHDSPNLYVAGSAVFVTCGASNPTLTIAALSHRLADHVDSSLRQL